MGRGQNQNDKLSSQEILFSSELSKKIAPRNIDLSNPPEASSVADLIINSAQAYKEGMQKINEVLPISEEDTPREAAEFLYKKIRFKTKSEDWQTSNSSFGEGILEYNFTDKESEIKNLMLYFSPKTAGIYYVVFPPNESMYKLKINDLFDFGRAVDKHRSVEEARKRARTQFKKEKELKKRKQKNNPAYK